MAARDSDFGIPDAFSRGMQLAYQQDELDQKRRQMQQQMMLAHADQVLQERHAERAEQERQAKAAKEELAAHNERVASGMPGDDSLKISKAVFAANGIDAKPSIKPRDPNKGGGYEYSGWMPGQQEPFVADPVRERQRRAANRAAAISVAQGGDPEAEGLMPRMQQRVAQSPGGQQAMSDFGEQAGMAAGGQMAQGAPMMGGMAAIAGIPGQPARTNLAPSDPATAVAQQADIMNDPETLMMMRNLSVQRSLYGQKGGIERMKEEGRTARAEAKNATALEVTMKRLDAKRAGGGGIGLKDIKALKEDYDSHGVKFKDAEGAYQRTLNEYQQALQPKVVIGPDLRPTVVPPSAVAVSEIKGRLDDLKTERDTLRTPMMDAEKRYSGYLKARYGDKEGKGKKAGKERPAAATVEAPGMVITKIKVRYKAGPHKGRAAELDSADLFDPATMTKE